MIGRIDAKLALSLLQIALKGVHTTDVEGEVGDSLERNSERERERESDRNQKLCQYNIIIKLCTTN